MVMIVWQLDLKLSVQSMPITTNVVSLNRDHGEFVSNLHKVWFSLDTPFSSTNKTDCHDIDEILLKVVLNIIALALVL